MRIGCYVCHCGHNIAGTVNVTEVAEFAKSLQNVVVARDYRYLCSEPGQELIQNDIKEFKLDKVIIAACSPSMHKLTFMNNVEKAGLNPYSLERANIRENCSWVHSDINEATSKAKSLLTAALAKSMLSQPLETTETDVIPAALVIGAGIAGIQAALDLGNIGFKVYLIEKEPFLGGHLTQLNETFTSLDSIDEMIISKIKEIREQPNIEVFTNSEIMEVGGYIGNFRVVVKRKPIYIDMEKCTGCGECIKACPVIVSDQFNLGLAKRTAVYRPHSKENQYVIDAQACLHWQDKNCSDCKEVCKAGAIDFTQQEELLELEAGAIIVATGYDIFDPLLKPELGYGIYPQVITGLELERLSNINGPTKGKIEIDGKEIENVVFIQCVGSRDKSVGIEYCSRICCMTTAKQALYIREKIPDARITVCYIDIRAFGKGHEEFYERAQGEGIVYRRGNVSEIYKKGDKVVVRAEDTLLGEMYEEEADLVVLATGLRPRWDTIELAKKLHITVGSDGFFLEVHPKLGPVETATDGIMLAGCCSGPKDISDTVSQGHAAAVKASVPLFLGKIKRDPLVAYIDEDICVGCRLCETMCEFSALDFNERKQVMMVNELLCRGCGACSSICPSGANQIKNTTKKQVFSMITELV